MAEAAPIAIGSSIWWFDANHRVYAHEKPGEVYAHGGPVWRKHWRAVKITGETPRTWIVHYGAAKFSKVLVPDMTLPNGLAWSERELDLLSWAHEHQHRIADAVHKLDIDGLTRIARLIGYEPLPPS